MGSLKRKEHVLAIVLSSVAGYIDAVGFTVLAGRFVSFMSGNTTELAVAVGEESWGVLGYPVVLIVSFFVGAVLGGFLSRVRDGRVTVLATTTALVAAVAAGTAVVDSLLVIVIGLPLAMGVMNATFLASGEVTVGLTYMTGTLVKSGQLLAMALIGGPRWIWVRHLLRWSGLLLGGIVGAFAIVWFDVTAALAIVAAVLAAATTTTGVIRHRRRLEGLAAAG